MSATQTTKRIGEAFEQPDIVTALANLAEEMRKARLLEKLKLVGLTMAEAGELCDCTPEAVRDRLRRAKAQISMAGGLQMVNARELGKLSQPES